MLRLNFGLAESSSRSTDGFAKCGPGAAGTILVLGENKVSTGEGEKSLLEVGHSILRSIKDLEWLGKFCYRWR